ncbi:hypothetical protein ALQ08_200113 [Pseudomonas syringae pv. delphinii]|jgi:hypothetical protein|uniref:Uncharacterized protein n=2 Tax=Pseudomonas TaxID=286 RepID=A0A3M4JV36_9PSED|nr:hypothetical protein [Pseudomonas juntendi]MDH0760436.1 hypothetical protein [Pseudomonas juntendi]RMQ20907.1 hypothetical protein ALQ08_200113 [Pseudomonas syringae pv. delphinii]
MKADISSFVKHARRVNRVLILLKKQGEYDKAIDCKSIRNLWMSEARRSAV